jgi:hypothetical protein
LRKAAVRDVIPRVAAHFAYRRRDIDSKRILRRRPVKTEAVRNVRFRALHGA